MANGVIIESRIQATNIDALNRTAQATVDVAGGGLDLAGFWHTGQ